MWTFLILWSYQIIITVATIIGQRGNSEQDNMGYIIPNLKYALLSFIPGWFILIILWALIELFIESIKNFRYD